MKSFIIALSFLSYANLSKSSEVGGNGDALSAFFVRSAYILQAKMAEKESNGEIFLEDFKAEKFKSVLSTPIEVIGKDREEVLRGADGRIKDVKVIFTESDQPPRIFLRAETWEKLLDQLRPNYRLVLHAYLYAARLDDTLYQYSSLVPVESLGLADSLPDDPSFHGIDTNYPLRKMSPYRDGYLGISLDGHRAVAFNKRGIIRWAYSSSTTELVDAVQTYNGFLVLGDAGDVVEIAELGSTGQFKAKKLLQEHNKPLSIDEENYLTDRTIVQHDATITGQPARIVWQADPGVIIQGRDQMGTLFGRANVNGIDHPYITDTKFSKIYSEIEGELTAVLRTERGLLVAGNSQSDGKLFVKETIWQNSDSNLKGRKFLYGAVGNVRALVKVGSTAWAAVSSNDSSQLFAIDSSYRSINLAEKFSGEVVTNIFDAKEGGMVVMGSSRRLYRFLPSLGYTWSRNYAVDTDYDCNSFHWTDEAKENKVRCQQEGGVFNWVCSDPGGPWGRPPQPGLLTVRCDRPSGKVPSMSYEFLEGTWWSSFAGGVHEKDHYSGSSQFKFVTEGDHFFIQGCITGDKTGCSTENMYKVEGQIINGRIFQECQNQRYEVGGIQEDALKLSLKTPCQEHANLTFRPGIRQDLLEVEIIAPENWPIGSFTTSKAIVERDRSSLKGLTTP